MDTTEIQVGGRRDLYTALQRAEIEERQAKAALARSVRALTIVVTWAIVAPLILAVGGGVAVGLMLLSGGVR